MSIIVDINDFSNGSIDSSNPQDPKWDGTGVFDIIMKAANENIKIQSQTSRITGAEYAEVYLGTMQSAIAEAMKFLLNKDQIIKDLELKQAQIESVEADTLIKQEQNTKDLDLKQAQINIALEDKRLKEAQADAYPLQSAKDLEVKTQQVLSMQNDDDIKLAQSAKDLELKDKDLEVKTSQIEAAEADTLIKQEQHTKDLDLKYVQQIKLDKEAAAMGLDSVVKTMNQNTTPGYIYTPQYKKG